MIGYQSVIENFVNNKIEEGKIDAEEKATYEYAYLVLALQVFNIVTVLLIGLIFKCLLPMILFVAILVPLRSYAGGYHADTPERCSFLSAILELFAALLISSRIYLGQSPVLIILTAIAGIVIWCLVPIEAANKPLSEDEENRYRKKARTILLIEMIVLVTLHTIQYEVGVFVIAFCHVYTAFSLLVVKLKKKTD